MRLLVVNGPNSDLPTDLGDQVRVWGSDMGLSVDVAQSDDPTQLADQIRRHNGEGIVIDFDGLTGIETLVEELADVAVPVIEVSTRRQQSPVFAGTYRKTFGRGLSGYRDAMRHLANRAAMPFETIGYGPHPDNVGDLRGEGDQLVVLVHGGLWRLEYERDSTESLAVDLARRGYRTWNIEYRRLGDGGGWPGSADDVLAALDTIPTLGLDAARVSVIGHSAGSYLLMWAAERTTVDIELHVALGPLLDLESAVESGDVGADECSTLLRGGAPRLDPGRVRTVLVHGDTDQIVPVERSVAFSTRYGLEHYRTSAGHFSLLDPRKAEWEWVLDQLAGG